MYEIAFTFHKQFQAFFYISVDAFPSLQQYFVHVYLCMTTNKNTPYMLGYYGWTDWARKFFSL